jgi:hypothetical protein
MEFARWCREQRLRLETDPLPDEYALAAPDDVPNRVLDELEACELQARGPAALLNPETMERVAGDWRHLLAQRAASDWAWRLPWPHMVRIR